MPISLTIALVVLYGLLTGDPRVAGSVEVRVQDQRPLQAIVWVNTRTRVYHCPAGRYYGRTDEGEFMSEAAARGGGNRASGGAACRPGTAVPPKPRRRTDVWVDTAKREYHCPGAAAYAATDRGKFLTERAARAAGVKPAVVGRCS